MNRLKKNVRCLRNDRVKNYIACVSACLCYSSQLFKESADFRSHLHGLQFDHGDYMADSWNLPIWQITEQAVGAGVTSILFFVTLKKIRSIKTTAEEDIDE